MMNLEDLKKYMKARPLEVVEFWYLKDEKYTYVIARDLSRGFMTRTFFETSEEAEWIKDQSSYASARKYLKSKYTFKGSFKKVTLL